MSNLANKPIRFSDSEIEQLKPSVYNDINGKSELDIERILQFHVNNCRSIKFVNASYNYSNNRAIIDVICYFKDWEIPIEIIENDLDRINNPDKYYTDRVIKRTTKRKKRNTGTPAAARRNKVKPSIPDEVDFVVIHKRRKGRPTSRMLFKKMMK